MGSSPATFRQSFWRYSSALLVVAAALVIRWALNPYLGEYHPYVTLYPAIAFVAWYSGLWKSVTAGALGLLVADYLWVPPLYSLRIQKPADFVGVVTYVLAAGSIIMVGEANRRRAFREATRQRQVQEEREGRLVAEERRHASLGARAELERAEE